MATDRGADVVRRDGKAFARFQWESWSPHGWFDDAVFNAVAESLKKSGLAEHDSAFLSGSLGRGRAGSLLRRVGERQKSTFPLRRS
jgi:hypothetical protein